MDKQKQIEEMENFFKRILPIKAMADWIPIKISHNYKGYAEALYNAGYRKIPENAVVLKKDEAVDLFNSKASGFMTSAIGDIPLNIDGMRKLVDEISRLSIVEAELQELNAKYYNEAKDLRRELKRVRKETAEKFAERLKEKLEENSPIAGYDLEDLEFDGDTIQECIDEIYNEIIKGEIQ